MQPKNDPPADETTPAVEGGSKKKKAESERAKVVQEVMAETGKSLIEASKYVKEHGLYCTRTLFTRLGLRIVLTLPTSD